MNTLADRMNVRMTELSLTQEELAKLANVSQSAIHKLCSGKAKQSRKLLEIAAALKVQPQWLATGDFPKYLGMDESGYENIHVGLRVPVISKKPNRVPVVGTAQLGDDGYWAEIDAPVGDGDGFVKFESSDANAYAVRCRGASMMPRIRDGEFVILEPNRNPIPGDDVLVRHRDGRVMVKRFLYERDGMIHLLSINEAYPPHAFPLQEVELFHPVGGISMKSYWTPI
jgi:phage repressor protein C with HTH and peptisase S24 domain